MKYLKLFENKEIDELRELIPEMEELCQDLKDRGFEIVIYSEDISFLFDFLDKDISNTFKFTNSNFNNCICCLILRIIGYNTGFKIDNNFIDNLLFIESYAEDMKLKVNYHVVYFVKSVTYASNICYYKNIENLPKDEKVSYIEISFIKA